MKTSNPKENKSMREFLQDILVNGRKDRGLVCCEPSFFDGRKDYGFPSRGNQLWLSKETENEFTAEFLYPILWSCHRCRADRLFFDLKNNKMKYRADGELYEMAGTPEHILKLMADIYFKEATLSKNIYTLEFSLKKGKAFLYAEKDSVDNHIIWFSWKNMFKGIKRVKVRNKAESQIIESAKVVENNPEESSYPTFEDIGLPAGYAYPNIAYHQPTGIIVVQTSPIDGNPCNALSFRNVSEKKYKRIGDFARNISMDSFILSPKEPFLYFLTITLYKLGGEWDALYRFNLQTEKLDMLAQLKDIVMPEHAIGVGLQDLYAVSEEEHSLYCSASLMGKNGGISYYLSRFSLDTMKIEPISKLEAVFA